MSPRTPAIPIAPKLESRTAPFSVDVAVTDAAVAVALPEEATWETAVPVVAVLEWLLLELPVLAKLMSAHVARLKKTYVRVDELCGGRRHGRSAGCCVCR